jgi:hypothetical protein
MAAKGREQTVASFAMMHGLKAEDIEAQDEDG